MSYLLLEIGNHSFLGTWESKPEKFMCCSFKVKLQRLRKKTVVSLLQTGLEFKIRKLRSLFKYDDVKKDIVMNDAARASKQKTIPKMSNFVVRCRSE